MFKKLLLGCLCLFLLVATGCGIDKGIETRKKNGEVIVTAGDYILKGDYDPTIGWGQWGPNPIHTGLLKIKDNGQTFEKDLAKTMTISPDGLRYTFTIRDDVKFSDGTPLTAQDVAFTFNQAKKNGGVVDVSYLESVVATSPTEVVFTLQKPWSAFTNELATVGIVSEKSYDKSAPSKAIGTGPWKIADFQKEQQLVLVPNEYYYGEKPKLKKVTVININSDSALAAAKSGQLDILYVSPEFANASVPNMHLVTMKTIDTFCLNLPMEPEHKDKDGTIVGNNVTSDIAIRKALNIGINRKEIIKNALSGMGEPTFGFFPEVYWSNKDMAFEDNRVEEAKALLEKAGWVDKDGDGIREKNGVKAEFIINGRSNDIDRYNTAVALAENAKKLGINIIAKSTPWSEARKVARHIPTIWAFGQFTPQVLYNQLDGSQIGVNVIGNTAMYNSPFVNDMLAKGFAATTQEDSAKYLQRAQGYEGQGMKYDIPYLWIVQTSMPFFVRDGLDTGKPMIGDRGQGMGMFNTLNEWHWK